ncbi:ribulokinase [Caproicibacter sp.]|uniref:ribulokinase n=1 Tax=Caproicibacter sp. TaxID=2814884 RepID=UPI003988E3E8
MAEEKYVIGIDFGTLSARGVLVKVRDGAIVSSEVKEYPHGVMDKRLPDGTELGPDWALQHPQDYLDCISEIFPTLMKDAGVTAENIIGVGSDFTTCSILPTKADGTPLCFLPQYRETPHAYAKLWKHHAAQREANELNRIAAERGENFLSNYGGKISSEWMIPKIWQILNEAPEIFNAAERIMECGDWVVFQLTGEEKRSSCQMGYKAIWQKETGYPPNDFFRALDPRLEHVADEKLSRTAYPLGTRAGTITKNSAKWTGLNPGTPVAVSCGDAHAAVPGAGITRPDVMLMVIGTSGCDMMVSRQRCRIPGICGICEDGILPGYFGYEAGQSCIGDHFQWFVENMVSTEYRAAAKEKNMSVYRYFDDLATQIRPGESGLLALDWWNGNRSVLVNADLTGLILGMTLRTKPEEIYKALAEAVAFGKRKIIDTFQANGAGISELYATGGISEKSPFVMQTLADVIGKTIKVSAVDNATCMGAAVMGAVAAGVEKGGYGGIPDAASAMSGGVRAVYVPNAGSHVIYERLYQEYCTLHDYFGIRNNVMERLKKMESAET